jgi:hypothetical protein
VAAVLPARHKCDASQANRDHSDIKPRQPCIRAERIA